MSSIRVRLSRLTTKKVPALSLVLVGLVGMVAGVLAATITVTTTTVSGGEQGLIHTTGSILTFADNGLSAVSNAQASNASATFYTTGNKNAYVGTFASGNWQEAILITDTVATDTASHALTITITQGSSGSSGTALGVSPVSYTVTGVTGSSSPTITLYIDLGVGTLTTPLNIYIKST
ncbi:MAG TPA: hypothetical protein VE955_00215 [Candidatus Dormibacteraeota bacterium]|nr:hypothetical protein [Candidatus Dormibacteraeota bacterium]